jgi:magnesium transporter
VYVVDARSVFKGALTLETLLVSPPERAASQALRNELVVLSPNDDAGAAAKAFERYDLVAAPVVDERGKLLGRLTVDAVLDYVRDRSEREALRRAGLSGEEDLFAPAWDSARNRRRSPRRSPWPR